MVLSFKIICIVIFSLTFPSLGSAQFVDTDTALKIEKQYLNRRYDGYYKHVEAYKNYQKMRVKRVKEHKLSRLVFAEKLEAKRRAFIVKRDKRNKVKKVDIDIDAIVAKQTRERDKIRNKKRLKYISNRKIMSKLRRTSKKIPIDIDVGLKKLGQKVRK